MNRKQLTLLIVLGIVLGGLGILAYKKQQQPFKESTAKMGGDVSLIGVRSRATLNRPFTVVKEMQAQAQARYQDEITRLQKDAEEAKQKILELQGKKDPTQRNIRSKEQQEEIDRYKQKEAQANMKLKEVRRNLRQDIDALENRLKWGNIIGMPLVVAIAGIALGISRKQKTKAQ